MLFIFINHSTGINMNKVKFNTHSLNQVNIDRLPAYYKFYKAKPDDDGFIYPGFTVLKMLVSFSRINKNAASILTSNEELIAAILAERTLTNSDMSYINHANNTFINSIIALTT